MLTQSFLEGLARSVGRRLVHSSRVPAVSDRSRHNLEVFNRQIEQRGATLVEKVVITAKAASVPEPKTLLMNLHASPYLHCAKHLSAIIARTSSLAYVTAENGESWYASLGEVINTKADVEFLTFRDREHIEEINEAFWRSCYVLLGALLDKHGIHPRSSEVEDYHSGRFSRIAAVNNPEWKPKPGEIRLLTRLTEAFIQQELPFEVVSTNNADFEIPEGVSEETDASSLKAVRVGDFVDFVDGPVIAHTGQIGKFEVVNAEKFKDELFRFSGVALPMGLVPSSFAWDLIAEGAKTPEQKSASA